MKADYLSSSAENLLKIYWQKDVVFYGISKLFWKKEKKIKKKIKKKNVLRHIRYVYLELGYPPKKPYFYPDALIKL